MSACTEGAAAGFRGPDGTGETWLSGWSSGPTGDASPFAGRPQASAHPAWDRRAAGSPGCGHAATGERLGGALEISGTERTYALEIPHGYDPNTPYPLVFGFHGDGGSSEQARNGYRLFELYAGEAIVVYPDGSGAGGFNSWDTRSGSQDDHFVMKIAERIADELCVDPRKVFAFGYSRGAVMANAVGCDHGDVFTGIGAASGLIPARGPCRGSVAAFLSHGEQDATVPFSSGLDARDAWLKRNHCLEGPAQSLATASGGCTTYPGCDAKAPVVWCTFDGAHSFQRSYATDAITMFAALELD